MNFYLDASALVKQYIMEPGSVELRVQIEQADLLATARITQAEVVAALSKAVRVKAITRNKASQSILALQSDWDDLFHIEISQLVVNQAAIWAWEHGLRGYDAIQLAAAATWQGVLAESVTVATYDQQLWIVARQVGVAVYPPNLPTLLASW